MACTSQVTVESQSSVARRKKKPSDVSTTKAVTVVDTKYVTRIEYYKKFSHEPDFDEEPYDFSDYSVKYWCIPNAVMLDLI